ncbi:MAG: hypothetical protein ABH967_01045 [Patescibacteria group bacterium]
MLTEIRHFVKDNINDIIFFIILVLMLCLCFALGFIIVKNYYIEPLKIQ